MINNNMKTLRQLLAETTDEKEAWFEHRTNKHIALVQKYCRKIHDYDPERFPSIIEQGKKHDASKFEHPEKEAYIHVNWHYRMKDQGKTYEVTPEMQNAMYKATFHHIKNNLHHPEAHTNQVNVLNTDMKHRDEAASSIVDATKMPDKYIAELVADWCGMAEEKGNTPRQWADKNIGTKWKFTEAQTKLIYELIDAIW